MNTSMASVVLPSEKKDSLDVGVMRAKKIK